MLDIFLAHIQSLNQSESDVALWQSLLAQCTNEEKMLVLHLSLNSKKHKLTNATQLKKEVQVYTVLPLWIIEVSQKKIKDNIEALSLLLPRSERTKHTNLKSLCDKILSLKKASKSEQQLFILNKWKELGNDDYYLFHRIICGIKLQEVVPLFLEQALAQYLDVELNWVRYCIALRLEQAVGFYSLFQLNETEVKLLPNLFMSFELALQENNIADFNFIELHAGQRVQLVSNGRELIVWSYENELLTTHNLLAETIKEALPFPFTIEGEIISVENNTIFKAWKIHKVDLAHEENVLSYFQLSYLSFEYESEIRSFQEIKASTDAGLLAMHKNLPHYYHVAPIRKFFKAVLMYAQRAPSSAQIESITMGLASEEEYISIGKIKWSELDSDYSDSLRDWILANKLQRIGPIILVPAHFVFELSCTFIVPSSRHKSGYKMHDMRLEKSAFTEDLSQITDISFLATHALES